MPENRKWLCNRYNACLDNAVKSYPSVRTIKLKEIWDKDNGNFVSHGKFTTTGLDAYWSSLDATFKFNAQKRDQYLAKLAAGKFLKKEESP